MIEIVQQRGNIKKRVIVSVKENDRKITGSREKSEEEFKCYNINRLHIIVTINFQLNNYFHLVSSIIPWEK